MNHVESIREMNMIMISGDQPLFPFCCSGNKFWQFINTHLHVFRKGNECYDHSSYDSFIMGSNM